MWPIHDQSKNKYNNLRILHPLIQTGQMTRLALEKNRCFFGVFWCFTVIKIDTFMAELTKVVSVSVSLDPNWLLHNRKLENRLEQENDNFVDIF